MPQDTTNSGIKGKSSATAATGSNITVIRREQPKLSKGQLIMAISDKIFPSLMNFFQGKRDRNGLLLQPAHVRGIALNIAEDMIKKSEQ